MTIAFEDLLTALCSQCEPQHANDFQKVFIIADAKEAKLVFDVLVAYGFDAKVYPDNAGGSKLYITPPASADAATEQKFAAAIAYAGTLAGIKANLDELNAEPALHSPDYTITFANAGTHKQINIVLTQATTAPARTAQPRPPVRPAASRGNAMKKTVRGKEESFSSGPTLGKHYYPGALDEKAQAEQSSLKRQIFLYMTGNAATGGTMALFVIILLSLLFTLFVLAKSFLCPDFAVAKKNTAWYCQQGDE